MRWPQGLRPQVALGLALVAVVAIGLLLLRSVPPPEATDLCDIFRQRPAWHAAARASEKRWSIDTATLMAVISQESGFEQRARPARRKILGFLPWRRPSSAYGYAQVVDGTWRQYETARGEAANRRSFADAVDFVGWYLGELGSSLGIAVGDTGALYAAYHEGPAGYRAGSHLTRPGLENASRRVSATATRYRSQLDGCSRELRARLLWWQVSRLLVRIAAVGFLGFGLFVVLRQRFRRGSRR